MKFIDLGLPSGTRWAEQNLPQSNLQGTRGIVLPSREQFLELFDHCKVSTDEEGVKFTGPNGNSIVLPLEGYAYPLCDPKAEEPNEKRERQYAKISNRHGYYRSSEMVGFNQVCLFLDDEGSFEMRATENTYRMSCRTIYKP